MTINENETIEIITKLEWKDYKRFVKVRSLDQFKVSPASWLIFLSPLFIILAFSRHCHLDFSCYAGLISDLLKDTRMQTPLYFLGFFIIFPVIIAILVPVNAKKYFDSNKKIKEETKRIFSMEGMQSEANTFSSFISWADIYEVKEYKEDLSIFISTVECHIIPKRFFKSAEDLEKVKEIIKSKVEPKKLKLLKN